MFEVFDWDKEFTQTYHKIKEINSSFQIISKAQQQESDKLTKLEHEIRDLAEKNRSSFIISRRNFRAAFSAILSIKKIRMG